MINEMLQAEKLKKIAHLASLVIVPEECKDSVEVVTRQNGISVAIHHLDKRPTIFTVEFSNFYNNQEKIELDMIYNNHDEKLLDKKMFELIKNSYPIFYTINEVLKTKTNGTIKGTNEKYSKLGLFYVARDFVPRTKK